VSITTTRMNKYVTVIDCSATSLEGDTVAPWRDAIVKALEGGANYLLANLTGVENYGSDAATAWANIERDVYGGKYGEYRRLAFLIPEGQRITGTGHIELYNVWTTESQAVEDVLAKDTYEGQ
jgi:hypothetical protein